MVSVLSACRCGFDMLVLQVKDDWPPTKQSAIETIAASYNPVPKGQAGVRLFNLSPVRTIVL